MLTQINMAWGKHSVFTSGGVTSGWSTSRFWKCGNFSDKSTQLNDFADDQIIETKTWNILAVSQTATKPCSVHQIPVEMLVNARPVVKVLSQKDTRVENLDNGSPSAKNAFSTWSIVGLDGQDTAWWRPVIPLVCSRFSSQLSRCQRNHLVA